VPISTSEKTDNRADFTPPKYAATEDGNLVEADMEADMEANLEADMEAHWSATSLMALSHSQQPAPGACAYGARENAKAGHRARPHKRLSES
jgi:hypothetical protein